MEKENHEDMQKNGDATRLPTKLPNNVSWNVNITEINLSARNIDSLDDTVHLPPNLLVLNLSHNKLVEVPTIVSKLRKLKSLDLSHNTIQYFDETPYFCHTLEQLDLSRNSLFGPPYWIWTEKPKNLFRVNLSFNTCIAKSLVNGYLEELLLYKTTVLEIDFGNCGFNSKDTELLSTLTNAKTIIFGSDDYSYHVSNTVNEVPDKGLEKCCNVQKLNLSNTHIYNINSSIDKLNNLYELNLSCNNINSLPNELCNLLNLEICILSNNNILYLPNDVCKLNKLVRLYIDHNKLCMLPENLFQLPNLKVLDLYDNELYEIVQNYSHLEEFDVAMNYMDEPTDIDYLVKREKIRLLNCNKCNGRKLEEPETEYSSTESDDEEYYRKLFKGDDSTLEQFQPDNDQSQRSSSPEDWDSDTHWVPHDIIFPRSSPQGWIQYIKRKMREGNFCPLDAHVVSISEQVMYEKRLNPRADVVCVGQFDDYSSDES